MKRFESFENNLKDAWPDHPSAYQLRRIRLTNTDESALFNSEEWCYQYNVSLESVHIKILWFENEKGANHNRPYFLIIGFVDGRKIEEEFINFKDENFFAPRDIINAFCFGR